MSAAETRAPETALEYALAYAAQGWSVVPVRQGEKMPAVPWAKFQALPADPHTIRGWFDADRTLGLGLVQGRNASSIVLDFDGEAGHATLRQLERQGLPPSPRVLTPGGGVHVFLRHPGVPIATRKQVLPGMDVRGDGGFVVAPPSKHANGGTYHWDVDHHHEDAPLADVPPWLLPALQAPVDGASHLAEVTRATGSLGLPGAVADGREAYMRDTVLAVARDMRDRLGRLPTEAELIDEAWPQYARNVDFSRPGRGREEFAAKCRYTLARAERGQIRGFEAAAEVAADTSATSAATSAEVIDPETGEVVPAPPSGIEVLDPTTWTAPAAPRQWVVQDWIPRGVVTALYGDGGMGKSLLAQQLMTSVALGQSWVGLPVVEGRALGIMCEDDPDELHRRQEAINQHIGAQPADLRRLRYVSRVGFDNILMAFDGKDVGALTAFFAKVDQLCANFRPDLLVFDTIADGYGGNENNRPQVRQFVQNSFGRLARTYGCGVLACGHPSVSGISSGAGTGGSTAWNNTVRSRMYLTKPDDEDSDPNARILSRKKANYAAREDEVALLWQAGAFVAQRQRAPATPEWKVITGLLDMIQDGWDRGVPWSATKQAGERYLPGVARYREDLGKPSEAVVVKLLREWTANGVVEVGIADKHTKQRGLKVLRRIDHE